MTTRTEEERVRAYDLLMRQIGEVRSLVDNLLGGSIAPESAIVLNRKPVSLRTILTTAENQLRSTCDAIRLKVTFTLPREPIYLVADAARLEKVFGDLFSNACKRSGGECRVTVTAERESGVEPAQVAVRVRDDGAAIDAELLPRIFEASGGSSPDLALVQRIVKMHGGSVEAVSAAPGKGAEFIVRLPILEVVSAEPTQSPSAASEARRRILIVDDNLDSVEGMATLQKRRGHEVRTAATGPEALEVAAEFHPDVVLLDIGLPGMDGFEVARQLRASPEFRSAFLVAMTGYATADDRRHAKEVGFDEHLIKPVDLNRLRTWLADETRFSR
jgi:CheY-like chemotaxis protein